MKIEISLGFSHIRDALRNINVRLAEMEIEVRNLSASRAADKQAELISLRHLRDQLLSGLPVEMRKLV